MSLLILSELKQRIRGKRWWIALVLWTLILLGLVALVRRGYQTQLIFDPDLEVGLPMFGFLALFVLGLACLVVPSLTAMSVNGERDRGTLAILQATLLRPHEIFLAKLASATIISLVFLVATVPIALWAATEGGVEVGRAVVVYAVLAVSCVLLACLGMAASALLRKPPVSTLVAYTLVFLMTAGLPVLFGLALVSAPRDPRTFQQEVGWRWVLLAPDPFVVLADAAPRTDSETYEDPLAAIRDAARSTRSGGAFVEREEPPPVWPVGLGVEALLAVGAAYLTIARLKVPVRNLGRGERVA